MKPQWASGMRFQFPNFDFQDLQDAMRLRLPERVIEFPRRPLVMGIVNVNDDSFSGDGTLDFAKAIQQARDQIAAGADVIDVGAESARTNRAAVSVAEELRRFRGLIEKWPDVWQGVARRDSEQIWPPILSANTWRPEVVAGVLKMGNVELVNDMGALPDDRNARACADHGAALLIMHSVGEPKISQFQQQWTDVMAEMERFFREKIQLATTAGLNQESIILDPGIDFAKQRDDNLTVFRELHRLHQRSDGTRRTTVPRPPCRSRMAGDESAGSAQGLAGRDFSSARALSSWWWFSKPRCSRIAPNRLSTESRRIPILRDSVDKRLGAIREHLGLENHHQLLSALAELKSRPASP